MYIIYIYIFYIWNIKEVAIRKVAIKIISSPVAPPQIHGSIAAGGEVPRQRDRKEGEVDFPHWCGTESMTPSSKSPPRKGRKSMEEQYVGAILNAFAKTNTTFRFQLNACLLFLFLCLRFVLWMFARADGGC